MPHLSVDLTLPTLVPAIAEAYGIAGERAAALARRARSQGRGGGGRLGGRGRRAPGAPGRRGRRRRMRRAPRSTGSICRSGRGVERDRLGAVLDGLAAAIPALKVTVDPVENRGFEYHTGISFTFFARVDPELGPLGELGRGGRYRRATRRRPSRRPASRSTPTRSCAPCPRRRRAAGCWCRSGADPRPRRAPCAPRGGSPSRRCSRRPTGGTRRAGSAAAMCWRAASRARSRAGAGAGGKHGQCRRRRRPMGR